MSYYLIWLSAIFFYSTDLYDGYTNGSKIGKSAKTFLRRMELAGPALARDKLTHV